MTTADFPETGAPLGATGAPLGDRDAEQDPNWMTVSAEKLYVDTQWIVSGRGRLRRKVETRTANIQLTLRPEGLIIATDTAGGAAGFYRGVPTDGPAIAVREQPSEPISMVLREEVPEISVTV